MQDPKSPKGQDPGHKEGAGPDNRESVRYGSKAIKLSMETNNDEFEEPKISSMSPQEGVFPEKEKDPEDDQQQQYEEDHQERLSNLENTVYNQDQRLLAIEQYVTSTLPSEMEKVFDNLFQNRAQQFSYAIVQLEGKMSELWGEVSFDRMQLDSLKAEVEKLSMSAGQAVESLREQCVVLEQNNQGQLQDLTGECGTIQGRVGQIQSEIEQRFDKVQKEIDFHFDRLQQSFDQHVDRRVDRYLSTVGEQLRASSQLRPESGEIFQTLQNQMDQLRREILETKEVTKCRLEQEKQEMAKFLQEFQDQQTAQRLANHDLADQVRMLVQSQSDRVEQVSQQVRVDRSDQMLLWSQLDQSEKQFQQQILEMQATHKNELARHIRSIAEELGAVERKFQADRIVDRGIVQEVTEQIKALQNTQAMLKIFFESQGSILRTKSVEDFAIRGIQKREEPEKFPVTASISNTADQSIRPSSSTQRTFLFQTQPQPLSFQVALPSGQVQFSDSKGQIPSSLGGTNAIGSNVLSIGQVSSHLSGIGAVLPPAEISGSNGTNLISRVTDSVPLVNQHVSSTDFGSSSTVNLTNATQFSAGQRPIVTSPVPNAAGQGSIVTSPVPNVAGQGSIVTSPVPSATGQGPTVASSVPNVVGQGPIVTSPVPMTTSQVPVATSPVPIVTSQVPMATSPVPMTTSQVSFMTNQISTVTNQPISVNQGPVTTPQISNVIGVCPMVSESKTPASLISSPNVQSLILTVKSRPKGNDSELLRPNVSGLTSFQFQMPGQLYPIVPNPVQSEATVSIRPIGIQPTTVPSNLNLIPTPQPQPVFLGSQSAAVLRAESAKPRRFSGLARDFRAFERDLEIYFSRWTSVQEGSLTDRMKLDILEEVTDEATAKTVREWRQSDPNMDFPTAWRKVRKLFGEAVTGGARQEWRALRFEFSGKASTSVVSWRNFSADFTRLRKEVPDCSEGEAIEFLRERLPHSLLSAIDKEETLRRKRNGAVVKLMGLMPLPESTVAHLLNAEGVTGLQQVRIADGAHEAVMTDYVEAESLVTRINGLVVECGGITTTISARRLGSSMTASEIIDHLTEHLTATARVDEEAKRGFFAREAGSLRDRRAGRNRDVDAVSTEDLNSPALSEAAPATPKAGDVDSRVASKGGGGKMSTRPDARGRSPGLDSAGRRSPSTSRQKSTPQRRSSGTPDDMGWIESAECYFCGEIGHLQRDCPMRSKTPQNQRFGGQKSRVGRQRGRSQTPSGRQSGPDSRPNPTVTSSSSVVSGNRGGGSGPEVPQPRSQ